uniref:Spermatosis associated 1 n=1 Tax=Sphenodon punctatus TaxID=8508 RepID=A0A8D0LB18_SPHPU
YRLNPSLPKFFSAGFIRVSPHISLRMLREQLGKYLGEDAVADKFIFLKCIGKNLAVVKAKQETELKLKSFAPPYALFPELYLLPGVDHVESAYYSSSLSTPDRQYNNPAGRAEAYSSPSHGDVTATKQEPIKNPTFLGTSLKNHLSHKQEKCDSLERTEKERETVPVQHVNENPVQSWASKTQEKHQTRKVWAVISSDSEMIEQLTQMKAERKSLERTREELVKKAKGLLEQHNLRRYHARDAWKKKYFETKKVTAFLEENLNKVRQDLELYYQKLLSQLEARESRKRPNNVTPVGKNNTIIQITTVQHEIDQLKRKLDNTKMKLVIEIKMRKQVASDLRALRAELAQKKIQSSFLLQSRKPVH